MVREGPGYPVPMDCAVRVRAPGGYHLTTRIETVAIPFWNCTYDNMSVIDYSNTSVFCGFYSEDIYEYEFESIRSTTNWLQFAMQAVNDSGDSYSGFSAYYTAIHPEPCNNKGKNATEVRCSNGYCAPKEVACDGLDNCGDWSDESELLCGLRTSTIIIIVVDSLVVGCCIIYVLALLIWEKCYKKTDGNSDE